MATYSELRNLFNDSELGNKIEVALIVSAYNLIKNTPTPTAEQKAWAVHAFNNTALEGKKALKAVLAANKDITTSQIQSASDSAVQTKVDEIAQVLVDAFAGV